MPSDSTASPNLAELRDRVLAHLEQTVFSLADHVEQLAAGWGARTRDLQLVWTLNQLHVTRPTSLEEVLSLADSHQADLPYRHVVVDDEPTGRALEVALSSRGWHVDRELSMVLLARPARVADASRVSEMDEPEMLDLMRHWIAEDHPDATPEGREQVVEYSRREGRLWGERRFGVRATSGRAVALTKLRSDPPIGWVEDVYTLPPERRNGYARSLVTYVTALAESQGHELVHLTADDNDWPKHLYYEIGYRPVGTTWTFHRAWGTQGP